MTALAHPDDPDHAERLEWLGSYDPAAFDRAEVNARLTTLPF